MAHLTGFGLENFRVFGKETWFDFAPITIFTGTNSSGKSSVNKALLLLNESYKKNQRFQLLSFSTDQHQLNSFENTISNKNSTSNIISFKERYKLFNQKKIFNEENNGYTYQKFFIPGDSDILPFSEFIEINKTYNKIDNKVQICEIQINIYNNKKEEQILSLNYNSNEIGISILPVINLFNRNLLRILREITEISSDNGNIDKTTNIVLNKDISDEEFNKYFSFDKIEKEKSFLKDNKYFDINNKSLLDYSDGVNLFYKEFEDYEDLNKILNLLMNKIISESKNLTEVFIERDEIPTLENLLDNLFFFDISKIVTDFLSEYVQTNQGFNTDTIDKYIAPHIDSIETVEELKTKPIHQLLNKKIQKIIQDIIKPELQCIDNLLRFKTPLTFIEAVRANTQRLYTFQSQGTSVNNLLLEIWEKGLSEKKTAFLSKWVKEFGIGDSIEINNVKNVANELVLVRDGKKIDIADVGYGYTQLLPMLIKCIYVADFKDSDWCLTNGYQTDKINPTNGRLIIMEEPETNLHPALQSKIADFIVDFSKHFDATIIIETHSEYLIRRLQYLTAKKEIKSEDTIIHYLFNPESEHTKQTGEQLRTIRIQQDGRLDKEFGTGFFDESTKLMMSILSGENLN